MLEKAFVTIAAAGALLAILAPTASAGQQYVALGDSYSSGTGTGEYYHEPCQRSKHSYARIVARERPGTDVILAACSGAETADVLRDQVGSLSRETRWVSITIGGNDAGFSRVVAECAKPGWAGHCGRRVTEARQFIRRTLPERLRSVYEVIERRAPDATVIVLSYPRLLKDTDCDAGTFFSEHEMERLNDTAELLRDKTSRYARAAGQRFRFRDAIPGFAGHAVCSGNEWLNGLERSVGESFHPNRAGHRSGYVPLVRSVMD